MSAPRVSVICIFYNAERYFREAIDSVLAQDFRDFELILADDGSSDGSTGIAQEYVASNPELVRYVEHPNHANLGMSAARNLGLSVARGEFIAMIDSDDRWRVSKLREQVAILDERPHVGIVCGNVNYWKSWEGGEDMLVQTGNKADVEMGPPETSLALYPLGTAPSPCPSDALIRRRVVDHVGGYEARFSGMYEDQGFFGKVWLVTSCLFSSRVWLDYRLHNESCVATGMRDGRYEAVRAYYFKWFEEHIRHQDFPGKPRIEAALRKARWRLKHPILIRLLNRTRVAGIRVLAVVRNGRRRTERL